MAAACQAAFPGATVEHLGTGGFGSTFKVTEPGGQVRAVKLFDPAAGNDRIDRELAAIQRVSSPHVAAYSGLGAISHGGISLRWLAMEFVAGTSLSALVASGRRLTLLEAVNLLRQLVDGAAAIWAQDTAHRDLSPNNILVTTDDRAVIVDLGLARHLNDNTITTLPTPGTPGWMSPEQVGAVPQHGDSRSDQYVLGLLGWWMVTGVRPFHGSSFAEWWLAPANQTVRPLVQVDASIPRALSDVLERMTRKEPFRRYLRVEVLLEDLQRAADAVATAAPTSSTATPAAFVLVVTQARSFASAQFLAGLRPDGVIVDPRSPGRTSELTRAALDAGAVPLVDPVTFLARSAPAVRPRYCDPLPWARLAPSALTGLAGESDRRAFCEPVLTAQVADGARTLMAPYFFAGPAELEWVRESLACARTSRDLLGDAAGAPALHAELTNSDVTTGPTVWTTVAINSAWLSATAARGVLLTELTGERISTLQLLVATTQPSFAPLADPDVLAGFDELLTVMTDAGVPVVVSRRGTSGLLLLALGASGWATGVHAKTQNMTAHPVADESGGPGYDWVYLPALLNSVTTGTFALLIAAGSRLTELSTPQGRALLAASPDLSTLTSAQRVLLLQHNVLTQRQQAGTLAAVGAAARRDVMRAWVADARATYANVTVPLSASESGAFLPFWADVL